MAIAWTQVTARLRADDGSETTANWLANEGANGTINVSITDAPFRVRINAGETGTTASTLAARLYIAGTSGVYAQAGTAYAAGCYVRPSANVTDDGTTTNQMAGTNNFVSGRMDDDDGICAATGSIARYARTQHEYSLGMSWANVHQGDYFDFRERSGTAVFGTYTVTIRTVVQYVAQATFTATLGGITTDIDATIAAAGANGTLTATLAAVTSSITAQNIAAGNVTGTLGAITSAITGKLPISGALTGTLGGITASISGDAVISGTGSATLGALTLLAISTIATPSASAQLSVELNPVTISATGVHPPASGTLIATLGTLTTSLSGALPIAGAVTSTLNAIVSAADADLVIVGAVNSTLGNITISAQGSAAIISTGAVDASLGAIVLASTSALTIYGSMATALGAIDISASGELSALVLDPITGQLNIALAALILVATNVAPSVCGPGKREVYASRPRPIVKVPDEGVIVVPCAKEMKPL